MSLSVGEPTALSEIDKIRFLQRLKQLQNLCSGSNPNYPRALLSVPGPDGRGNRGSLMLLKYLFQFSVGKELFEGNLDDRFECLEEMILLIQEHTVSVIVTAEAKAVLAPFLSVCPFITVYCSAGDVSEEVDEFQARKAATFKKLMLQAVAQGGVVGLPIPLGYDSVLDVENWSLMRSFAMESVVAGVGFFTAHFTVIDVTEALEILFRSVDSAVVSKVIEVIKNSIVPNVHQSLRILSGRGAVENRTKITSEDILSPLDFLFDFGELETVYPPDPLLKPVALFAQLSNTLGTMPDHIKLAAPWKNAVMPPGGVHVVTEGCEPSTGVRWCRTFFTQRGRQVCVISDPDSLVTTGASSARDSTLEVAADINRLETIYILLWEGLRAAVREVFGGLGCDGELTPTCDVVSAGEEVERSVEAFMKARLPGGFRAGEVLRIHMDCMNGLGQLCKAEDVEDIGGQCLAYLRVSVHGIETSKLSQPVAVAVGDTFLFSPHSVQVRTLLCSNSGPGGDSSSQKHLQDAFCLTNAVPYMLGIFGIGTEDSAAQRLMNSLGSTHLLSLMGLGEPVEAHGSSSAYTFPMLTDHSSNPYFQQAELSFYDGGFVFERLNGAMLPGVINFETHVERIWTVDVFDVLAAAQAQSGNDVGTSRNWLAMPEGLIVILKLKEFSQVGSGEEGKFAEADKKMLMENPFDSFLPEFSTVRHVAFVVRSDMPASSGYYNRTAAKWKRSIRTNEIPDHRGMGGDSPALPAGILASFLALYDHWGVMSGAGSSGAQDIMAASNIPQNLYDDDKECAAEDIYVSACGPLSVPGAGFLPLKSLFTICENARIYTAEAEMIKSRDIANDTSSRSVPKTTKTGVVVVVGLAGSTAMEVATALLPRLPSGSAHAVADCSDVPADQLKTLAADIGARVRRAAEKTSSAGCVLLSLIIPTSVSVELPLFLDHCVAEASSNSSTSFDIKFVMSVVAGYHFVTAAPLPAAQRTEEIHFGNNRMGSELFAAATLTLCRIGVSDMVICTDSTAHGSAFATLRHFVREVAGSSAGDSSFKGELPLFRLKPPVMRLDDELVSFILSNIGDKDGAARLHSRRIFEFTNLTNVSMSSPFAKIAEVELSDEGDLISNWLSPRFLDTFSPAEIVGYSSQELMMIPEWRDASKDRDFDMVVKCLRTLFPKANLTSTTANPDVWAAPPPDAAHPVGSLRRAMQMATAKVVIGKQFNVNRERMSEFLTRNVDPRMLQTLQCNLRSVYGIIELPGGAVLGSSGKAYLNGQKTALIDACAEFISIKIVDGFEFERFGSSTRGGSRLVASGTMNPKELIFLDNMISQSFLRPLERRSYISYSDLSDHELSEIQRESRDIELPGGCWFDGNVYLDVSGSRSRLRPDIRNLAESYILKRNAQIDIYNKLISDADGKCLSK